MTDRRLEDLRRFYTCLDGLAGNLGGPRRLAECSGRLGWPTRGVYFFFEWGEERTDSGTGARVVRVGTHALNAGSSTRLWTRLAQHRGQASSGGGNHRGSIFRLIIGTALMARAGTSLTSWGQGANAPAEVRAAEVGLEEQVSQEIGAMPFVWLAIEDEAGPASLRGYIERNAIALLSNYDRPPIDASSTDWLGRHCDRERVRRSGLWNSNHVHESHDPAFLDTLEQLVANVGGKA